MAAALARRSSPFEDADLVRLNPFSDPCGNPCGDGLGLLFRIGDGLDCRGRAVEHRHGAAAILGIAVDIGERGRQQPVGSSADLVRGPVVDAQRIGPAAHIDAERAPRKRLLEDPLSEIPGEEQAIRPFRGESGEKPQFGEPDILRLVDDDKIERRFVSGQVRGNATEQIRPGDGLAFGKANPHALENRPQHLALLAADAGLAAEPGDIAVVFPTSELPRVDDLAPFADQEPRREPVPLDLRCGLAQQGLNQRRRGDVRLAERRRVEVVSDPGHRMDRDPVGDLRLVAGQRPQPDAQRVCERL